MHLQSHLLGDRVRPLPRLIPLPSRRSGADTSTQNIWNAAWSSIQALSRTYPATFALLPANQTEPLRGLIREIIDVGFAAGLLRQGDMQYNLGKTMGGPDEVAGECWDLVSLPSLPVRGIQVS